VSANRSCRPLELLAAIVLLVTQVPAVSAAPPDRPVLIRIHASELRDLVRGLAAEGLDVAGVDLERSSVDIVGTDSLAARLAGRGLQVAIVERLDEPAAEVDSRYLDPSEVEARLLGIESRFPDLAKLEVLGVTEQGRPYYAVKVSDNVMVEEDEPAIFFIAEHHAREVMTPEVAIDILTMLLRNYSVQPLVKQIVDSTEIWVIPNHNPDGSAYAFSNDDFWRKNRRNNGDGSSGVDNNRNYPFRWGSCDGSSGNTSSETYRGPAASSEPETNALTDLALEHRPVFAITYHTYSELVLYSYGCTGTEPPDRAVLQDVGGQLASRLVRDSGSGTYTPGYPWQLLYAVDGEMSDWFYARVGTLSFTVEMNSSIQGFHPSYDQWRNSTVSRNRAGWAYLLQRLNGPSVRGHVTDAVTGQPVEASVSIDEIPLTAEESPRRSDPLFGRYQRILLPGTYHVRFQAPGYQTHAATITVGSAATDLDVALAPAAGAGAERGEAVGGSAARGLSREGR